MSKDPKKENGDTKDQLYLVPPEALRRISRALKYGAFDALKKDGTKGYGAYNWRYNKIQYSTYLSAILRHTIDLIDGNDLDLDSKLDHLDHIGANIAIVLDARKHNTLIDDRSKRELGKLYPEHFYQNCSFAVKKEGNLEQNYPPAQEEDYKLHDFYRRISDKKRDK